MIGPRHFLLSSLVLLTALLQLVTDLPLPQIIVRSQSLLYNDQPGRQVDLTKILPTTELFWLNIEEGYFACQVNSSEKYLKLFKLSRLCDGNQDCYEGSDELVDQLKCTDDCQPACGNNGVCLKSRPESQCHCDDGFGGDDCSQPDVNECKYRPCSIQAECTNTLGSFVCTCMEGYQGDGFNCQPATTDYEVPYEVTKEDILTTIKEVVEDASKDGKFEDPNIDLTILPSIDVISSATSSSSTTETSTVIITSTVKESVMMKDDDTISEAAIVEQEIKEDSFEAQPTTATNLDNAILDVNPDLPDDVLRIKESEEQNKEISIASSGDRKSEVKNEEATIYATTPDFSAQPSSGLTTISPSATDNDLQPAPEVDNIIPLLSDGSTDPEYDYYDDDDYGEKEENAISDENGMAQTSEAPLASVSGQADAPSSIDTIKSVIMTNSDPSTPINLSDGAAVLDTTASLDSQILPQNTDSDMEAKINVDQTATTITPTQELTSPFVTSSEAFAATEANILASTTIKPEIEESTSSSSVEISDSPTSSFVENSNNLAITEASATIITTSEEATSNSELPLIAASDQSTDQVDPKSGNVPTTPIPTLAIDVKSSSAFESTTESNAKDDEAQTISLISVAVEQGTEPFVTTFTESTTSVASSPVPFENETSKPVGSLVASPINEAITTDSQNVEIKDQDVSTNEILPKASSTEESVTPSIGNDINEKVDESRAEQENNETGLTESTPTDTKPIQAENGLGNNDVSEATTSSTTVTAIVITDSIPSASSQDPYILPVENIAATTENDQSTPSSSTISVLVDSDLTTSSPLPIQESTVALSTSSTPSSYTDSEPSSPTPSLSTTIGSESSEITSSGLGYTISMIESTSTETTSAVPADLAPTQGYSASTPDSTSTETTYSTDATSSISKLDPTAGSADSILESTSITSVTTESIEAAPTTTEGFEPSDLTSSAYTSTASSVESTPSASTSTATISSGFTASSGIESTPSSTTSTTSISSGPSDTASSDVGSTPSSSTSTQSISSGPSDTASFDIGSTPSSSTSTTDGLEPTSSGLGSVTSSMESTPNFSISTGAIDSESSDETSSDFGSTVPSLEYTPTLTTTEGSEPIDSTSSGLESATFSLEPTTTISATNDGSELSDLALTPIVQSTSGSSSTTASSPSTTTATSESDLANILAKAAPTETSSSTSTASEPTTSGFTPELAPTTAGSTLLISTSSEDSPTTFASSVRDSAPTDSPTEEPYQSSSELAVTQVSIGQPSTEDSAIVFDVPDISSPSFFIEYKACENSYVLCDSIISYCEEDYDNCKSNSTSSSLPAKDGPKDELLIADLSECILALSGCTTVNCFNEGKKCALLALEQARQRRIEPPASRANEEATGDNVNEKEIGLFNSELSNNFTSCVYEYSDCLKVRGDQTFCRQKFHECSLAILDDGRLDDEKVQSFVYDPSKNLGMAPDQQKLSGALFLCIHKYMMCTLNTEGDCMRIYNQCTLQVLDKYHSEKSQAGRKEDEVPDETTQPLPDDDGASEDPPKDDLKCDSLNLPEEFGSFNGKPATNTADCTWDFFSCTNNFGSWPDNMKCCEVRFDKCCEKVTGKKKGETKLQSASSTTTKPESSSQSAEGLHLIDCVWGYMGCARADKPDEECKAAFNECSNYSPEDNKIPITGLGSSLDSQIMSEEGEEVPESDSSYSDSEYLLCIKRVFLCERAGIPKDKCENVQICVEPVEVDNSEPVRETEKPISTTEEPLPSYTTSTTQQVTEEKPVEQEFATTTASTTTKPNEPDSSDSADDDKPAFPQEEIIEPVSTQAPPSTIESEPTQVIDQSQSSVAPEDIPKPAPSTTATPVIQPGPTTHVPANSPASSGLGSQPSKPQCVWAYFGCGARNAEGTCKQRFDDCMSGNSFDYKICKDVDENPQAYLVPHPEDCTKFYSCQNLGWKGGYIAHLMDCPPTTGFDTNLRICNYIRALPRCTQEKERKLFREVEGLIAKQTRFKKQILDVPQAIESKKTQTRKHPEALKFSNNGAEQSIVQHIPLLLVLLLTRWL